jgi:hypothetical protein
MTQISTITLYCVPNWIASSAPLTNLSQVGPRDLDHHSKWPIFLRLHGSITPEMILPLIFVGGWATAITCISKFVHDRKPPTRSMVRVQNASKGPDSRQQCLKYSPSKGAFTRNITC